jgi:hypothetical protein
MGENAAHLLQPEALTKFNQEAEPGNSLLRAEFLSFPRRLWNQSNDLQEWSHRLKPSHRGEGRALPEDMRDLCHCITRNQEENRRETNITKHEMMADERDHTDMNVTMIQLSSVDSANVLRDLSVWSGWIEWTGWNDQIVHLMTGTGKSTKAEKRLWLLV